MNETGLELEMQRLRMSLKFVIYNLDIKNDDDDISVTIKSYGKDDVIINSTFTSSGIYDIIDEVIYRKIDRTYIDNPIERKTFFHKQDQGYVFMYDENTIYATLVNWIDRKGLNKQNQLELYGNFQIDNYDAYERHIKLLKESTEVDVNRLLEELANESIVALNQEEVAPVKDLLNMHGFAFETWRRDNDVMISLIEPGDNEMLFECLGDDINTKTDTYTNTKIDTTMEQEGNMKGFNNAESLYFTEAVELLIDKGRISMKDDKINILEVHNELKMQGINTLFNINRTALVVESADSGKLINLHKRLTMLDNEYYKGFNLEEKEEGGRKEVMLQLTMSEIHEMDASGLLEFEIDELVFFGDYTYLEVESIDELSDILNSLDKSPRVISETLFNEIMEMHHEALSDMEDMIDPEEWYEFKKQLNMRDYTVYSKQGMDLNKAEIEMVVAQMGQEG